MPLPAAAWSSGTKPRFGGPGLRGFRVRMQMFIGLNYLVDTAALGLFAWVGTLPGWAPPAYGAAALLIATVFLYLVRRGVQEAMPDPYIDRLQRACAWSLQLVSIWLFPHLAFFFLNTLFVIFAFSFHQPRISWRQLALEWSLILVATGSLSYLLGPAVAPPLATQAERALVWSWYVLTLGRCAYLGYLGTRMRARLATLNREVRALNEDLEGRVAQRTRELQESNEQLYEFNRQLQSFARSVAHDFRQPIISISGQAGLLARKLAAMPECKVHLDRIVAASHHMDEVCNGLVRLARVNNAAMERRQVDVSHLAREIAEELQESQPGRAVEWQIEEGLVLHADRALVGAALEALMANAWKFSSTRASSRISVRRAPLERGAGLLVEDNGVGFDAAYAHQLFGLFQRLHTEEQFPGAGIGLAIVDSVARRHGGRAWASGLPQHGAQVGFTVNPG